MNQHSSQHRAPEMDQCIDNCNQCHAVCLETISHCLAKGGRHAERDHVVLMSVCADICRTSADAMLRGSDVHRFTCGACAEICRRCADSCAAMGDDAEMQRCAEMCRRCADSCATMAA